MTPFWFRNEALQSALQSFHRGNELAERGKYRKATLQFQQGIIQGKPIVLQLQQQQQQHQKEEESSSSNTLLDDNPYLALEWLAQTYVASSKAYIRMGDYDAARRDAWGACMLSPNNQNAIQCMITVCVKSGDAIGELSSLKMLLSAVYLQQQEYMESSSYSLLESGEDDDYDDEDEFSETEWDLFTLKTRIAQLQEELAVKYNTPQRNDTHVVDG
ncbi:MAG: hypothetical protein SGILL_005251 [Bacillariaceae sp.]